MLVLILGMNILTRFLQGQKLLRRNLHKKDTHTHKNVLITEIRTPGSGATNTNKKERNKKKQRKYKIIYNNGIELYRVSCTARYKIQNTRYTK